MKNQIFVIFCVFVAVFAGCQKVDDTNPQNLAKQSLKSSSGQLIAYYPFNGNVQDYGLYAKNGTNYNATLTTDKRSNASSAYAFNGSNAYVSVPSFGDVIPTEEITVSLWAKSSVSKSVIALYLGNDASRFGISIDYSHNGENSIFWDFGWQGDGGDANGRLYQTGAPFDQNWHHYVFVSSIAESVMKIYKDGALIAEKSSPLALQNAAGKELMIGKDINNAFYQGSLDDIRIFNYPISETEVGYLYSGLVAYYPFSGNADDLGLFSKNGTVNNAELTADRLGNANSAYYFNGTNGYIEVPTFGNIIPTKEISVSLWAASDQSRSTIAVNLGTTLPRFGLSIDYYHNGSNSIFWDYGWNGAGGDAPGRLYVIGTTFNTNWHHYVFISSITQSTMKIYKDGALIASKTSPLSMTGTTGLSMFLGKFSTGFYKGKLDDIKVFDYPLTATEVTTLYNE